MSKKTKLVRLKMSRKFKVRDKNRCPLCGRSRGYLRRFDMCRICFRTLALEGRIPGVTKSSW